MNFKRLFKDSNYVEKMMRFDVGIKNIEAVNPNLFEEGELSMKFLMLTQNPNVIGFGFTESVPARIEKEVRELFYSVFQKFKIKTRF